MNKCQIVKLTCSKVVQKAKFIKINSQQLDLLAQELSKTSLKYQAFDEYECHITPKDKSMDSIVEYIFILDCLNFCFWKSDWEYDNLASSIKKLYEKNPLCLKPKNIILWDLAFLRENIFESKDFPLLEERLKILHEVSEITLSSFNGEFTNIVKSAENSAVKVLSFYFFDIFHLKTLSNLILKLVYQLTSFFNNFQDHALYEGEQICFYKRSQIFVADLWGALKDKPGYEGFFPDIGNLTTFPDYRVPQILNHLGVLVYCQELQEIIDKKIEILSGSQYEVIL